MGNHGEAGNDRRFPPLAQRSGDDGGAAVGLGFCPIILHTDKRHAHPILSARRAVEKAVEVIGGDIRAGFARDVNGNVVPVFIIFIPALDAECRHAENVAEANAGGGEGYEQGAAALARNARTITCKVVAGSWFICYRNRCIRWNRKERQDQHQNHNNGQLLLHKGHLLLFSVSVSMHAKTYAFQDIIQL